MPAATAEYRLLRPWAAGDSLAVSGEVNRIIAAAINTTPNGSGTARMREPDPAETAARYGAERSAQVVCSWRGSRQAHMVVSRGK
jgi:hypothetical protein